MRAGVLSAGILNIGTWVRPAVKEHKPLDEVRPRTSGWNEDAFARQQIGNLVRQAFFSTGKAARHVVFSGVELDSDVNEICWGVGQALACERPESVLVVVRDAIGQNEADTNSGIGLRNRAHRVERNLWRLAVPSMPSRSEMDLDGLRTFMAEVRREFEYSVVADCAGGWMRRASLAELADGMVLVLSALRTRRASARKVLEELSHVRLLGTVLQDRVFPIPEGIYRRL